MPDLLFFLLGLLVTAVTLSAAVLIARSEAEDSRRRAVEIEAREKQRSAN